MWKSQSLCKEFSRVNSIRPETKNLISSYSPFWYLLYNTCLHKITFNWKGKVNNTPVILPNSHCCSFKSHNNSLLYSVSTSGGQSLSHQWLLIHCILTVQIPFYVFLGKEQIKPRVQVMFVLISIELTCRKHHWLWSPALLSSHISCMSSPPCK